MRTEQAPDVDICKLLCLQDPNCVSINFKAKTQSCDLNNATHRWHDKHFVDKADYVYHGTDSACDVNPCNNRSTCQSGFTDKRYRCLCYPGFTGEDCEHDVDECSVSPSVCDRNAICHNNEGSYICSCADGFAGDGKVCKAYENVGCYKDAADRAISSLEGLDPILDAPFTERQKAIVKCAAVAMAAGYSIFAVQNGGQCFSNATAPQTFDKYGNSSDCEADGEGGLWASQVYYIKGYESVGCYNDTRNRAIPTLEGKDPILDGNYRQRKNPIAKCAVASMRAGYRMFAVQHGGWCASSATAQQTFDKYGESNTCQPDGEGGGWANQVYTFTASPSR